MELEIHPRLRI